MKVMIQYKWGFMLSLLIDPIIVLINISLFTSIYTFNQTNAIAGYDLAQMIWYFAGTNFIWYFTYNHVDHIMSDGILSGDLATFLLKPASVFSMLLGDSVALRTAGVLFEFVPSMILYSLLCTPTFMTVFSFGRFLICIVLSFFMMVFINFLVGLSAFVFKNNFSVRNLKDIVVCLLGGAYFPLDFYPEVIRQILDYLPFKYVFYVPLQLLINREGGASLSEFARLIGIQVIWILLLWLVCKWLWNRAIKHFCAVGG